MCNCATSSFSSTPQAQCPVSSYSVGQPRRWLSATLGFPFALESSDLIIPFPSLSRHRYHANCHPRPAPRSSKDKNRFHPCSQWGGGCVSKGWLGRKTLGSIVLSFKGFKFSCLICCYKSPQPGASNAACLAKCCTVNLDFQNERCLA